MGRFILLFFLGVLVLTSQGGYAHALKNHPSIPKPPEVQVQPNLVVISCSGKSGSTTLEKSFKNIHIETFREHQLTPPGIKTILTRARTAKVILIDSIRDILSRKISSYFHNLEINTKMGRQQILDRYAAEGVDFLLKDFATMILPIEQYYGFQGWKKLGYDCLSQGVFDFDKNYQVLKKGNIYFVNIRFKDIENWASILQSINLPLNLTNLTMVNANNSEQKWYKDIYNDFKSKFTLSQATFDAIMAANSLEMSHFFTAEELDEIMAQWKPHIVN